MATSEPSLRRSIETAVILGRRKSAFTRSKKGDNSAVPKAAESESVMVVAMEVVGMAAAIAAGYKEQTTGDPKPELRTATQSRGQHLSSRKLLE